MNIFDKKLIEHNSYPLQASDITTLQVNVGYKCNLRCTHCHVKASPERKETMSLETLSKILDILRENEEIITVDITGGSPELNPYYRYFIKSCADMGKKILTRTNLAVYSEKGMDDIPQILAENKVKIIASLPCYSEEGVDTQRGKGTYKKAVDALKKLNSLGYGKEGTGLEIDIMFNPAAAAMAPDQKMLENAYKDQLGRKHEIVFNHLVALSNMPIGRLGSSLSDVDRSEYLKLLEAKFNPDTVKNLMCRHLMNVSPDGRLFDCDFWQMLDMPVTNGNADIEHFDYKKLKERKIVTHRLCLMCTAGSGASCSGALA